MIVGITRSTARVRCFDGTCFPVSLDLRMYEVPARNGARETTFATFDMRKLLIDKELPLRISGDTAVAARQEIQRMWPACEEKNNCLDLLNVYLEEVKNRRRDEFVIRLAKFYGDDAAIELSSAIRNGRFHFRASFLLLKPVVDSINLLSKEYPGSTRTLSFSPQTVEQAIRALRSLSDSKVAEAFRLIARDGNLRDEHIITIFETVKYLEGGTIRKGIVR